jgi:hypothetical protein
MPITKHHHDQGGHHQRLCAMAAQRLPPGTHQWLNALLAEDPEPNSVLSSVSSIDMARDCTAMDCHVIGIRRSLISLAQPREY